MTKDYSNVAVITCTGDRQQAAKFNKYYMDRQTAKGFGWYLIDGPGTSYDLNLYRALARLHPNVEKILIVEDDDWYSPKWVEHAADALDEVKIYGLRPITIYDVRTPSYTTYGEVKHASLCTTAFTRDLLQLFMDCIDKVTARWLDAFFWANAIGNNIPHRLDDPKDVGDLVVGIKNMPGRPGLGYAHGGEGFAHEDAAFTHLEKLIGQEDAFQYSRMYARSKVNGKIIL